MPDSAVILSRSDGFNCGNEDDGIISDCWASFAASAADRANAGVVVISIVRNNDGCDGNAKVDVDAVCVPRADGETADGAPEKEEEAEEGANDDDGVECVDDEAAAGARRAGDVGADRADAATKEAEPDDDDDDDEDDGARDDDSLSM